MGRSDEVRSGVVVVGMKMMRGVVDNCWCCWFFGYLRRYC